MKTGKMIRSVARPVSRVFPLPGMISLTRQKLVLPFYHAVSDSPLPHLDHVLKVRDTSTFHADLEFFLRYFQPIDARELVQRTSKKSSRGKPVFHLSFDDGLKEVATIAAPLLKKMGIPATFFINTAFIGNQEIFYRFKASLLIDQLSKISGTAEAEIGKRLDNYGIGKADLRQRLLSVSYVQKKVLDEIAGIMGIDFTEYTRSHEIYMNDQDIKTLLQQGFTIGSHSIDHPEFKTIAPLEQVRQANKSMESLTGKFRVSPSLFSFPFSDEGVSAACFSRINRPAGPVDLSFGISGLKKDTIPTHLHRIPMETGHSAGDTIRGEYLYYLTKAVFNRNKIHRR